MNIFRSIFRWIQLFVLAFIASAASVQAQTINQTTAANPSALPTPKPYIVTSRDANSAIWQRETFEQSPTGAVVTNLHQYTELATGLNFKSPQTGQWQPSSETILISADGSSASATNGQHQVYFPGDIYNGVIKLITPDGKALQSQPIGLSYFDGSNSVLLAVVTNSTGAILPSGNQVIYTNAFVGLGLKVDLIYTYAKAGMEQDVVLRTQPPDPALFGLNSAKTRLQVLTEFISSPQPNITATTVQSAAGNLEDNSLNFGTMRMGHGKAFLLGTNSPSVSVEKRWLTLNGRQFLIEEVPVVSVAQAIDTLPPFVGLLNGTKPVVAKTLVLPPPRLVRTWPKTQFLAQGTLFREGFVLDYQTINYNGNFTFQGDSTYYVSGGVYLYGTTTIEGGTVVKASPSVIAITIDPHGTIVCRTDQYRPGIFTSVNDDSVGETISGISSGSPQPYDVAQFFEISSTNITLHDLRFDFAALTMEQPYDGSWINIRNCQFINCDVAVSGCNVRLYNVLISRTWPGANTGTDEAILLGNSLVGENVTADGGSAFTSSGYGIIALTNCIITGQSLCSGSATLRTNDIVYLPSPTVPIYQTIGAGSYYLTNNSPYRNYGTTNIDQSLLADLRTKTTYPPAYVYTNKTFTNNTWTPQVQRDTNASPALGYHYAPIDYAVSGVKVNGILTLNKGVVVASFQQNGLGIPASGLEVGSGDQLTSVGTALVHNQICHYAAVQEQPILWGGTAFIYAVPCLVSGSGYWTDPPAILYARFTDFNGLAGLGTGTTISSPSPSGVKIGGGDPIEFNLRDCRIGPGWLACDTYQGADTNVCVNNLFDRGGIMISDFDGDGPVTIQNSLFHNGYITFDNGNQTYTWTVQNNFFDNSTIYVNGGGLSEDHNGYWNTTQLTPTNTSDVVVNNFTYATGPLGNYYQVSTNLLNRGSTSASLLSLYHYTVQTNLVGVAEVSEGTNTVSIGYHYLATDSNGIPLDSNSDGVPDYLEDPNGNGTNDPGEYSWNSGIILSGSSLTYIVGSSPKVIDSAASIMAPNCFSLSSGTLTISISTNWQPEDTLFINNIGTGAGQVGTSNNIVSYGGTNMGTFAGGSGSNALVINFTNSAASVAVAQAILQNVTYHYYPGTKESLTNRTVQFVLKDCEGYRNYPVTKIIYLDCPFSINVMLVIDCSSSMTEHLGTNNTPKINAATNAALSFLDVALQSPSNQVGLVSFADAASNLVTLTNVIAVVSNQITKLKANGSTHMGDGILMAQGDFPTNGSGTNALAVMVILTDGVPNGGTNVIIAANLARRSGIRLITIGLGTNNSPTNIFDPLLLTNIASTPDDCHILTNTDSLKPVYDAIALSFCLPVGNSSTVQIISPANQTLLARSNVIISATATNTTPGVTIIWVEFFSNTTNSLGFANVPTNGLYQIDWIPSAGGTNVLTALTLDSQGSNAWSAPVTNYVRGLPSVVITNPVNNQFFSLAPWASTTNIAINAIAVADRTGISNVVFYQGTNVLGNGTLVSSNVSFTWISATNGAYTLLAHGIDSNGATGISFPVNITVEPTNRAPSVYAGPGQTIYLPSNTVNLKGVAFDDGLPVGSVLSTTWTNLSGGANVTFTNAGQLQTTVSFATTGTYSLQLSSFDGQYTTYSTNNITVLPANAAPTVNAGTNQTIILPAQYSVTNNPLYAAAFQSVVSSEGKEFWLGFPRNRSDAGVELKLLISSETNTFASIMVPGIEFFTNCSVSAGKLTTIIIPNLTEDDEFDLIESEGIHIVAQDNISVCGLSHLYFSSDTYRVLPVNALGTNYAALSWGAGYGSEVLIVGTVKGTVVHFTPSVTELEGQAGVTYTTNLNEGQTYELAAYFRDQDNFPDNDLSGTIITANHPIIVLGGNELAGVPNENYSGGNFVVEQIPPMNAWGKDFFTVPFVRVITNTDWFQIVAGANGATVSTNGTPMITLSRYQPYQFTNGQPCHITANQPILLAQYASSTQFPNNPYSGNFVGDNDPGDPTMTLIEPTEQFISSYQVQTPSFATNDPTGGNYGGTISSSVPIIWTNFANIVVANLGTNSIYLDGTNLNHSLFAPISTSGYFYARVPLLTGSHQFTGVTPFEVYLYGFSYYWDAYSYPGGMSLGAVADTNVITLNPPSAVNMASTTIFLTACLTNQYNKPVPGVRVDFRVSGSNSYSGFAFTDQKGQARFYYTGTNIGTDTITASVGTNSTIATNVWAWPSVTLHGVVSDDGLPMGITNFNWSQISGPTPATFSSTHVTNPVVTVTAPGYYVFQFEGDDAQLTNYSEIAVSAVQNQALSVYAGTNQIVSGISTTLSGSASDDGLPYGVTNIIWSEVSGPASVTFSNATQAVATATFTTPGSYVFQLTGSDGQASVSSDVYVTVQINPATLQCGQATNDNLTSTGFRSISFTNSYATYYQFTGTYNEQVTVTTTNASFDTYLAIRDSQLRILAEDDDETTNNFADEGAYTRLIAVSSTNSQIVYTLPAAGTYIVEVSSPIANQTGSYTLQFSCSFPSTNGTAEIAMLKTNGQTLANEATVNLGVTPVGSPVYETLTITNQGTAALSLGTPTVSGDFTLTSMPITLIAPSNSTTLTMRYNASTNGIDSGMLTFADSDPSNNPFVLNLVATATTAGTPPLVHLTSPTDNATFLLYSVIPVSASATAVTGSVAQVSFFANSSKGDLLLGTQTVSTNNLFTIDWFGLDSGNYTLTAVATDNAGHTGVSAPVHIQISTNVYLQPVATYDQFTVLENSVNNTLYPLNNDSDPNGLPLRIDSLTQPKYGTATIINNGTAISYTPPPWGSGSDSLYYQITDQDGGYSIGVVGGHPSGYILINVAGTTNLPSVTLTNTPGSAAAGTIVPIVAYVNPSQYIAKVDFYQGKALIGEVTNGYNGFYTNFWLALANPCECGFTAQASDIFGQVNTSQEIQINVTTNGLQGQLTASLDSVSNINGRISLSLTNTIRDGLFTLYGKANHSLGSNVVWQLGVYSQDGTTLLRNLTPPSTGPVGSANTPGILVSNCDLTTLQNGVYDFKLTVSGGFQMASTDVQVILDSNLKLGQFSFSQQDLIIPVNSIPLTVTRTYDSINPNKGDFGYGWTFAINSMDVQLDETRQDIKDDDGKTFSERIGGGRDVTLTLPNGRRTTFYFQLQPGVSGTYYAAWQAEPGVNAKLGLPPGVDNRLETIIGGLVGNPDLYYWDAAPQTPWESYDFPGFVLTNQDGTVSTINRTSDPNHFLPVTADNGYYVNAYGRPYLSEIRDRNGNKTQIGSSGITNIAFNGVKRTILFHRNGDGLIDSITDPNGISGGPSAVIYQYDNNDNLIAVERLADRNADTYVTNSFSYTNANFLHYITTIINGDGTQVAENFYDNSGKLIAVQDANGNTTHFIHNTTNNTGIVVDRLNNTNTYIYDLRGNVLVQTNALNQVTTMAYDLNNNKTNEIAYLGNQPYATKSYVYNPNLNLLISSKDPLGHTSVFAYDSFGEITNSTDANTNATVNNYDSSGNLISTFDALNQRTFNSYAASGPQAGLLVGSSDPLGNFTTNYYDGNNNLTNTTILSPSSTILSLTTFAYDLNGNRTNSTVWRQVNGSWTPATTTYVYDAMNRVVQTINPDGGTNTVVYNLIGQQQAIIDPLGLTTSYVYDNQGRLIQTTYPDLTTETNGYDANGNRIVSADRLNRLTRYFYDSLNRATNTVYADNTTNTTVYDGIGRVAQSIDARGTITGFAYDAAGRRIAVTNAFGITGVQIVSSYTYDPNGNQLTFTDANNHTTTNVFDALNRQIRTLYPDDTKISTVYDADSRRVTLTNQDSIVTLFGYDGAGRLTSVTNAANTGQSNVTLFAYDQAGNETAQIDALGRTNTFVYDAMGRRIGHTMPGGQHEGFTYDSTGNLTYQTNFNGVVITNLYDVMNRLTNRASINSYQIGYSYTPTGQRQTMTDASGTTMYSYDNRDRLESKTESWNSGPTISLNYSYDADGNVTNILSGTANGADLAYSYDALNRLSNALANCGQLAAYTYDLAGNLQAMQYGNGVMNAYQYDSLNRLTTNIWKLNATTLASFSYQLGATGNRTALLETNNGANRSYTWKYDNLYRLTNEIVSGTSPTGTLGYQYDAVGNRLARNNVVSGLGLTNQSFAYSTNDWLTTDKLDNNGSTTNAGTNYYQYDAMSHVTNVNNGAVLLTYDGDGNRVSKVVSGTTTYFLLDNRNPSGYAQVLEEWKSTGLPGLSKVYNYGLDLISQRLPGVSTNYFICDGHGSTRMLTDAGGNFANAFAYDAFGTLIVSNSTPQTVYLYAGQQWDPDLGLYYNRARYLNVGTGRFWTMDTYEGDNEEPSSLHKYLYVEDNSVNRSDPSGNLEVADTMTAMTLAVGFTAVSGAVIFEAKTHAIGNALTAMYAAATTPTIAAASEEELARPKSKAEFKRRIQEKTKNSGSFIFLHGTATGAFKDYASGKIDFTQGAGDFGAGFYTTIFPAGMVDAGKYAIEREATDGGTGIVLIFVMPVGEFQALNTKYMLPNRAAPKVLYGVDCVYGPLGLGFQYKWEPGRGALQLMRGFRGFVPLPDSKDWKN